ncbi:MAG: o-succinylbenzoate--CoA ligase, partial [Rhodothermales bacterium]
ADRVGKVAASLLITDREDLAAPPWEGVVVMSPEAMGTEAGGSPKNVRRIALGQPATVVFTSGSSGRARAALHTFGNHFYSARGSNENIALRSGDRWLLALPLYHVGGLGIVFRCLLAGATLVVPEPEESTGEAVSRYGISHLSLVATQLGRLLREGLPRDPGAMKAVLLGGSAIPPSLTREAHARGWPIHTSYGMTETASQVATTPPGASLADLGTSGRVLRYRRIKVEDGEILVKGKTLFQGYVEGDTRHPSCDSEGWFHTGDLGTLSTDGFLRVYGRKDNMFISGGENIHPEEIERALCMLDGVRQAIVVPIADATFGHRPVAFVQTSGEAPVLEELALHLAPVLPRFKIPTTFYAWPEAASTSDMKVDRAYFQRCAMQVHRENT